MRLNRNAFISKNQGIDKGSFRSQDRCNMTNDVSAATMVTTQCNSGHIHMTSTYTDQETTSNNN